MTRYVPKLPPLDPCPVERVFALVGGRWKIRLLYRLHLADASLAELRAHLPRARPQVLTERLRELEQAGMLLRLPPSGGGWGSYRITPRGRSLLDALAPAADWGRTDLGGWEPPTFESRMPASESPGTNHEGPVRRIAAESAARGPRRGF